MSPSAAERVADDVAPAGMTAPAPSLAVAERVPRSGPEAEALWERVRRLVTRVPSVEDLRAHQLEALALRYWPDAGRPVPRVLVDEARLGAHAVVSTPLLLERVREACDGPLVLMKGPEVAARYPHPAMRPFTDVDVLARDAVRVQRALVAAGFRPVGDPRLYANIHHLRPLHLAGFPLVVEIHARPKWVDGLSLPPADDLFRAAVPSTVGVDGVLALPPAEHALVLAAHSWSHEPLGSLRQLIDVAAVSADVPAAAIHGVAARWGMGAMWKTTAAAAAALFGPGQTPWPLRTWARNLPRGRERTVFEIHLQRWLAGFSAYPGGQAAATALAAIRDDVTPGPGESWGVKRRRCGLAVRNAFRRQSEHDRRLEELQLSLPDLKRRLEQS